LAAFERLVFGETRFVCFTGVEASLSGSLCHPIVFNKRGLMTPIPVSITMLVKNAERHLEACLTALAAFDEIIVLDNGSTDRTLDIARRFPNVAVHHHEFIGSAPM